MTVQKSTYVCVRVRSHVYSNCHTFQASVKAGPGRRENILGGIVDRMAVEHGERVEGDGPDRLT